MVSETIRGTGAKQHADSHCNLPFSFLQEQGSLGVSQMGQEGSSEMIYGFGRLSVFSAVEGKR